VRAHSALGALRNVHDHDTSIVRLLEGREEVGASVGCIARAVGLKHAAAQWRLKEVADGSLGDTREQSHRGNIGTQVGRHMEPA